jgi:putative GTP pyrophosphokinase
VSSLNFEEEKVKFREWFDSQRPLFQRSLSVMRSLVSELLAESKVFAPPVVSGRIKDRDECLGKFSRKYQTKLEEAQTPYEIKDHVTDIVGLRVVCLYETDVPEIRKLLNEHFEFLDETNKTKSIEAHDDTFGYKGLHLDVKLKAPRADLLEYARFADLRFELQIRTTVQDAWSVLDHKIKYKRNIPESLKRRINCLAALFELADQEFRNIRDETTKLEVNPTEKLSTSVSRANAQSPTQVIEIDMGSELDAFNFALVGVKHFPGYTFGGRQIDGFVDEVKQLVGGISAKKLLEILQRHKITLDEYRNFLLTKRGNKFNPYTSIRHALYLEEKEKYRTILFAIQRETLDEWLKSRELKVN